MNKRSIGYAIGKLLQVVSLLMLIPLGIGLFYNDKPFNADLLVSPEFSGFFIAILLSLLSGLLLILLCRKFKEDIRIKEGYAVVTLGWIVLSCTGAIPLFFYFLLTQTDWSLASIFLQFTNAFFETMSGFTTTGSTILTDIESLPKGILFWRSMTHWLGGMGIITLALAIFPAMGVSGYGMYRGEVPGPTKERLQPRLSETAKILWGVYLLFTLVETVLLCLGGMPLFDSLCHTFGTLATGGFSTQNLSVGQYHNLYFHWVFIVFMFLSGVNYLIHYRVILCRDYSITLKDSEFKFYSAVTLVAILIVTGFLFFQGLPDAEKSYQHFRVNKTSFEEFEKHVASEKELVNTLPKAFSEASFQVVSIMTTTGFCTADFDTWPNIIRYLLVILMFWGGCAGSTGGGLKMIRVLTVLKVAWREVGKLARPRWIAPLKIGGEAIPDSRIINILALFNLFVLIFIISTAIMTLFTPDLVTAACSVVATLCNIGPGLNGVGAIENFAWIPLPGKWVLSLCMLLGRLEVFSVLIALRPSVWRK